MKEARSAPSERDRSAFFLVFSGLALGVILGLVWAMALRENQVRGNELEFEAYRLGGALLEEYLQDPTAALADAQVAGFGLYGPRGNVLVSKGTAPAGLDEEIASRQGLSVTAKGSSFVLVRPVGGGEAFPGDAMRGMMRGSRQGRGPGMMGFAPPSGPETLQAPGASGQDPSGAAGRMQARWLWVELPASSLAQARRSTFGAAGLISLGLVALYFALARSYRHNRELRARAARNSELVQLGEAARTLAHEIKNPLAVIRIQTATLARLELPPQAANKIGIIDEEVGRLSQLSDRIREFLRSGEGRPVPLELGAFLGDYAARWSGESGLPGTLVLAGSPGQEAWVRVDPGRLAEALDNLVRNAFEASASLPEGTGTSAPSEATTAGHAHPSPPPVELGLERRGRSWTVEVSDRGKGIAPEDENRLFEPFFTTKEKGSGIGLALARRIAASAGGSLEYRPRQGGGAVFSLSLPQASPSAGTSDGGAPDRGQPQPR